MKKLEERLNLLEQRLILLESKRESTSKLTAVEELFVNLGLVYVLSQASDRLAYEPKFNGYDSFLGDMFKCKISDENRMEYAHKLKGASDEILNKATETYKMQKMNDKEI